MRVIKHIALGLIMFVVCPRLTTGQNTIDSLRTILDFSEPATGNYMKTCVEFCDTAVSTDFEFLIPDYAIKALQANSSHAEPELIAALEDNLGNYYIRIDNLSEAANQFDKMRLMGETRADARMEALSYKGLGTVYYIMKEYDKANDYYLKGLFLCKTDSMLQARFCNNIGNAFKMQNLTDSAWPYYNKSITYLKLHRHYQQLSIVYCNLALLNSGLGENKEATRYLDLALETSILANDPVRTSAVYGIMGDLYVKQNPELSKRCYEQSLILSRKYHNYERVNNALVNLSELAEQEGDYKKALAYNKDWRALDDSIDLAQKRSRLRQIETDHLISLKKIEEIIKAQQKEIEMIRDENRQKIFLILLSVICLVLLVILVRRMCFYQKKIKSNRVREKFYSMIAHDIKNPFSGILGLTEILDEHAQTLDDPVHGKQMASLHQSLNKVYELLENLLQWSQSETGKIAFNPKVQLLSPPVHEVISLHQESGKRKGIRVENQIQTGLTARFDFNMLHTIIRNLLSNAIKFSAENSTIFISAEIQGQAVLVKVRDEGIGIDQGKISQILSADDHISTRGTQNETGTGLGLILCKDFVSRHGGRIWIESKKGKGTTVSFTLPD